jgi:fibronectin type 3 domain-containing protein
MKKIVAPLKIAAALLFAVILHRPVMGQTKPAAAAGATAPRRPAPNGPAHLHVRVLARAYEDSIVIRWAPTDPVAWTLGKDSGYRITRIDYTDPQHPVSMMLGTTSFRPLTHDQMMATLDRNNKYAAIAAQALYGNDFQMTKDAPTGFAKKIKQGHDALNFRYSFALQAADFSAPVASAIALRWVDKAVKKGIHYIYLITVNGSNKNYIVDSAAVFLDNIKPAPTPAPDGLQGFSFDRQIELHWNRRQAGNFSAYYIERSDDQGKTWQTLNKLPYYTTDQVPTAKSTPGQATAGNGTPGQAAASTKKDSALRKVASILRDHQIYMDSIPLDYHDYYYRVRGIDAFAELSPWSATVILQGRDLTPPAPPVINSAKNPAGSQIDIAWTQRTPAPDLAGYYISRSNSIKGPFYPLTKKLLPKTTTSFTDSAALPQLPNYYVVIAVDTAKNVAASSAYPGYLTDTIPPAAPVRIAGSIDSAGIVHLHWAANREADIKGYKVYYAYGPKDQFAQLTTHALADTTFTDTISMKSLNRRVWYEVVAVDKTNNHSAYSAPVAIKKLVVIPPTAPVAGAIATKGHSVSIEWIESRSEGAAGYEIFRRSADTTWALIGGLHQDWTTHSLHFTDSSIATNTDYYYTAETIDSTGSRSARSFQVHVRSNVTDSLPLLNSLQAKLDSKQQHVRLSWQYKDTGDYFFVIYRSVNNGSLDAWQSFDKTIQNGEDDQVASGAYSYAIKVVHRDRTATSALSKPIQVVIQ